MTVRDIEVLVFDQYGTIVDMQGGLTEAVTPFLAAKGWDGEPRRFVTWWRRTHFENSMIDALCQGGHTPYREIGRRAVSYVMDRCGLDHTPDEAAGLVAEIERLKPFPDVIAALERLRGAGYRLAILSNGDRDMLEAAKPHIGFAFDNVISVQASRARTRYSSPTTPSTASAPNLMACGPPSSTAASAHSARRRTSPT